MVFGDNVSFNGGFHLTSAKSIIIGNDCLGSWNVSMYDTDFHRMTSLKTQRKIETCSSNIVIGDHCWIGFGATILKGSETGDYCILGAQSLLKDNFSSHTHTILAGQPAKPVKYGYYLNKSDCMPEWHY